MSYIQLLLLVVLGGLLALFCKDALAYDTVCTSSKDGSKIVISTPNRSYSVSSSVDSGLQRTIKVKDMMYGSETDDYVSYTDGRYTVTYSLKCEML